MFEAVPTKNEFEDEAEMPSEDEAAAFPINERVPAP
jgi:hypothetical protein